MKDLDEALERFQLGGFEYGLGETPNYGPIAAGALVELGHDALIMGLIDVYAPRLPSLEAGRVLEGNERSAALGGPGSHADWLATFEAELEVASWQDVLRGQVARLAPGLGDRALHGLVRLAHAVLNLAADEKSVRVREVAFGLAAWAGRYEDAGIDEADAAASRRESLERIGALARSGAEAYLSNLDQRARYTVGVTAPAALRVLAPFLDPETLAICTDRIRAAGLSEPLVAGAARTNEMVDDAEVARCAQSTEEIRYRAACSLQEHAIAFAAACLREDAVEPAAALRTAAADAALRLSPVGYQEWR